MVWSLWPGYLEHPSRQRLTDLLVEVDVPLIHYHTSRHSHIDDRARLVDAFRTARVVRIHSEATYRFADCFPRVEAHADHEWWQV